MSDLRLSVVGIGGSAGGLETFRLLSGTAAIEFAPLGAALSVATREPAIQP